MEISQVKEDRKSLMVKDIRGEYENNELVKELLTNFDKKVAQLETEKKNLITLEEDIEDVIECGLNFLETLGDRWEAADLPTKQRFQSFVFPRVSHTTIAESLEPRVYRSYSN